MPTRRTTRLLLAPLAAAGAAALAYFTWVRPRLLRWGASPAEATASLPGDRLVPFPRTTFTRAITLRAAPAQVWPWLVQIGSSRAGWYSYDTLDNGGLPSADRIHPELQNLKLGDEIWAAPDGTLAFAVHALEPERALVLHGPLHFGAAADERGELFGGDPDPVRASWAFVLAPLDERRTRLLVRFRADYAPNPLSALAGAVLEPVSFLMERKMLLGIKARVERPAHPAPALNQNRAAPVVWARPAHPTQGEPRWRNAPKPSPGS
jgi:hypothetical protein